MKCPHCNKALVAINYGNTGVEIDYCPSCKGSWLEKGEFNKIISSLTTELLSKPVSKYVKASIEEAKEILSGAEGFVSEWKDFVTVFHEHARCSSEPESRTLRATHSSHYVSASVD